MVWYHPKYYAELRKKAREEKASSGERQAVDLKINLKRVRKQYTSSEHQAYTSSEQQAASFKRQATRASSGKQQAPSSKHQASSRKQQASE